MLKVGNQMFYRCSLTTLTVLASMAVLRWSPSAPSAPVDQTELLTGVRLINGEGGLLAYLRQLK